MFFLQLSVFGDTAWEWEPKRGQYYLHQFLPDQPDLNLRNEKVQEELKVTKDDNKSIF